jgi:hypothetical protein
VNGKLPRLVHWIATAILDRNGCQIMVIGAAVGKLWGKHYGDSLPIECATESAIKCLNMDGFEAVPSVAPSINETMDCIFALIFQSSTHPHVTGLGQDRVVYAE